MIIQSIVGLFAFIFFAYLMSENRKQVKLKPILIGVLIQLSTALILLKIEVCQNLFLMLNHLVMMLEKATTAGTSVVFGYLGGAELPFTETYPGASYILAFRALPLVLLISALTTLLFYWRIMPAIVKGFAFVLQKGLGVGGAEGLGISANIFVGMVEAPLFIRPYLKQMTRSEIFSLMSCGMATIAGTVMVLYAGILKNMIPEIMGHILTASIISAPAAITIAKIMVPETGELTGGTLKTEETAVNSMDAITKGTLQGVQLLINIAAMLIVLVGIVHLINLALGVLPAFDNEPLTLQRILGLITAPLVWLMGVPWSEAAAGGALMATKTILNEFIAYLDLSRLPEGALSPRSTLIMTYALCGFANPGSLGIMIGGLGTMAPERRNEIVTLGVRSIIAGTLATSMTGAIIGIII